MPTLHKSAGGRIRLRVLSRGENLVAQQEMEPLIESRQYPRSKRIRGSRRLPVPSWLGAM